MNATEFERGSTAIPAGLVDVALVDGPGCASAAGISVSKWNELVRIGEAPQPAFRAPRCTRWRVAAVRDWLATWNGGAGDDTAQQIIGKATRASAAAQAKRRERIERIKTGAGVSAAAAAA